MTEVGDEAVYCVTDCGSIEIVSNFEKRKYLGRCVTGDLRTRSKAAIDHRISCAWMKFRHLQHTLLDEHVDIKLRFIFPNMEAQFSSSMDLPGTAPSISASALS